MTHNEAIELLLKEYTSSDKKRLTELFIQTLPIGRVHFGLQVLSKMKTYYVHSYSIYDIPKTGDFDKDERLWIKENKKPFSERKYLTFENMTVEQQREIMEEPLVMFVRLSLRKILKNIHLILNMEYMNQMFFTWYNAYSKKIRKV